MASNLPLSLARTEATRTNEGSTIFLREQALQIRPLSKPHARILERQHPSDLDRLGLNLVFERSAEDEIVAKLKTGNLIGSSRYFNGRDYVDVVIEPKVGKVNFLQILEFCNSSAKSETSPAVAFQDEGNPASIVVSFVVNQIYSFLCKTAYRDYSLRYEANARNPKGRFDVNGYLTNCMPRMRYDVAPCSFFDFSPDVIENRVIATTLFYASRLAANFPTSERLELIRKIALAKRMLVGVQTTRLTVHEIDAIQYNRLNARFQQIHQLCRLLIGNTTVSLSPGRRMSFVSFSLNMSQVFERYVVALVNSAFGPNRVKSQLTVPLYGSNHEIRLDCLLVSNDQNFVIETKYKLVEDPRDLSFDEGDIRNADIYQCVAYMAHARIQSRKAFLVYPTMRESASPVEKIHSIGGFTGKDGDNLAIDVVLINLTSPPKRIVEGLRAILSSQG